MDQSSKGRGEDSGRLDGSSDDVIENPDSPDLVESVESVTGPQDEENVLASSSVQDQVSTSVPDDGLLRPGAARSQSAKVGDVAADPARSGKPVSIFTRLYHGDTAFRFLDKRRIYFTISLLIIVAGAISLSVRGLNFGIDFKGGTSWEVPSQTLSISKTEAVLRSFGINQATVVSLGSSQGRTVEAEVDLSKLPVATRTAKEYSVAAALAKAAGLKPSAISISDVGPTWGSQVTSKALLALAFFFVGIALYISLRFEWKMAGAALIAVVHDLLVTVGIYSIANFQITPDTVIAILTILGYSLYDTIVVFDRVGENTKALVNKGRLSYADSVNLSLNQVFMRSVNTSLVAIIPVLSILVLGAYVLGATTLRDFGLALFVGLTTGAYSSIGIASPLLAIFKEREPKYADLKARLAKVGTSGLLTPRAAAMAGAGGASVSSNTVAGGTQTPRPRPAPRKVSSKRKPTTTRRS